MKNFIKKFLKKIIKNKKIRRYLSYSKQLFNKYKRVNKNSKVFLLKSLFKVRVISHKSKGLELRKLFRKIKINIPNNDRFIYNIDVFKTVSKSNNLTVENLTVDYEKILKGSINDFNLEIDKHVNDLGNNFYKDQNELVLGIEELINRNIYKLARSNNVNKIKIIAYFENMKNSKANSFEEALQRILFYNQLLWQTGHSLNGLGRLDKILIETYESDIKNNIITREEAKKIIIDFLNIMHRLYWFKSSSLMGDTGQIIILGGKEEDNSYYSNDLTYLFIEALMEVKLPDPKILLRVSKNIPIELMEIATKCVQTGIGSPLFSNDDVVIDKMIEFGYEKEDAYNYVTSACWEPLIAGNSLDQNNIKTIVFINPLNELFEKENLDKLKSVDEILIEYKKYLEKYLSEILKDLDKINFEQDPLLSFFSKNCILKGKDISQGGEKYNNYGMTSVSLSNTVNSILNIKEFVFDNKKYTFDELNKLRISNFKIEKTRELLKNSVLKYGMDDLQVIELSNKITNIVNDVLNNYKNKFEGRIKFGLSAPSYLDASKNVLASFDGRTNFEPFGVHISASAAEPYTELIQFASKLDYSLNRFNGNVVDFIVAPSFIQNNFEKFVDFLILSIKVGFFQMQMNVISSDMLIRAKKNPKEFPNLIVRVWGFSSYFNDLPEEYKNVLIERALESERVSY
jgi:formate C-acetyltransferase